MRFIAFFIPFFLYINISAGVLSDFENGVCVNFDDLRYEVNSQMEPVDKIFYIQGNFSDRYASEGNISLNLFADNHCSDNNAGYFNRSWNGELFYCSSGGVTQCYRQKGLYTYMTELVLELLKHHKFRLFCIGSFADTNKQMFNNVDGSEEEQILGTAIGKTVINYFGHDAIVKAEHIDNKGYCIELAAFAW